MGGISDSLDAWMKSAVGFVVYRLRPARPGDEDSVTVELVSPSLRDIMGVETDSPYSSWFQHIDPSMRDVVRRASGEAASRGATFDYVMRIWRVALGARRFEAGAR